ncbi:MAG: hypothetical protein DWQ19_12670 [Crenarchaeota archaeon]|nr:MAG: hypothetical protein DWQ19_12670 [Thermoproteota archaeon]
MLYFKEWLNESPLGDYRYKFYKPPVEPLPKGTSAAYGVKGVYNTHDRLVISHPKTVQTLERVLSRRKWTFNIILYESQNQKLTGFKKLIANWMRQNGIPTEGRITFAKNGSSGDAMTPWMILHTMGHALIDEGGDFYDEVFNTLEDITYLLDFPGATATPEQWTHVMGQIFQFKSINNNKIKIREEFIYELFAEYLWNGQIRLKAETSADIVRYIQHIEKVFSSALQQAVGNIVVDHYIF